MFRIFTRIWRVFFCSVLVTLLYSGYEAEACISSPNEIKVPGSTFTAERITAGRTLLKGISSAFSISFGNTYIYHNGACWYNHNENQCLTQMVSGGGGITITPKNHPTGVGVLKWDDRSKKLQAYSAKISVSADGKKQTQQDPGKPYLEFHEYKDFCNGKRPLVNRCVQRYDSQGCNLCLTNEKGEAYSCTRKKCFQVDRAKADKCVKYEGVSAPCPEGVNLTVTAYSHQNGRVIGKYESRYDPNGPQARGMGVNAGQQGQSHRGVVFLGNSKLFSSNGCHVTVRPL